MVGGPFIILAYGLSENMTTVVMIIMLVNTTRNGASSRQFLEREGWINDAAWDNQTGIGSGRRAD